MDVPNPAVDPVLRQKIGAGLVAWFAENQRPLPWREHYRPYEIWISEIMLQQTQIARVVVYFNRWLERFPDVARVAAASDDAVLHAWEGLGYYSRARNIKRAACQMVALYHGHLPDDHDKLLRLPGIGPYTAAAIMSIAFQQDYPVKDANVERVVARLLDFDRSVRQGQGGREFTRALSDLLYRGHAREYNQALMELGALVCLPTNPRCRVCPVAPYCRGRALDTVEERPVLPARKKSVAIEMACGILCEHGKIYIQKRLPTGVWPNLWEFPGGRLEPGESPEAAVAREFFEETGWQVSVREKIAVVRHCFTIYRVTLHCYFCQRVGQKTSATLAEAQECRWVAPGQLKDFAFPAGHRKALAFLPDLDSRCG